ncbi:MAG: sigma-70 family RNA polymerase sigma factor [Marinilabiliaceae bacterium]|nr:sigma-70 family RNA polymerase sigma factor [Marinilabiliaceae bacterium]
MTEIDQIVAQCQKGNREAQKILYEKFAPKLFAVCIRYCKNRTEAEDFLHEGYIKIFENIDRFRGEGPIEAWMRRIMVNTILEELRNKQKISFVDENEIFINNFAEEEPETDEVHFEVNINQVNELIAKMPEKYKLVFNLYVVENYSHEQIAAELKISIGTSKSNLSRARKWLRDRLGELGSG